MKTGLKSRAEGEARNEWLKPLIFLWGEMMSSFATSEILSENTDVMVLRGRREDDESRLIDFDGNKESVRKYIALSQAAGIGVAPSEATPERSGRMHRRVDHRADRHALGASFRHRTTGRPPSDMALGH